MKTFAPLAGAVAAVLLMFALAGCTSYPTRTAQRIQLNRDFEVVETSARRPLTDREMAELRGAVARYLDQQDATVDGDYYVKVYLTPDIADATPDWVVVRFTRYSGTRYSTVETYGAPGYAYSPYYSYDLYPYGYDSFGRFSFQYYEDPFYGRRYYSYPRSPHYRDRHDRRDDRRDGGYARHDGNRGDRHDGDGRPDRPRYVPPPAGTNDGQVNDMPRQRRWVRSQPGSYRPANPGVVSSPPPQSAPPRAEGPRQWRGRNDDQPHRYDSPRPAQTEARAPVSAAPSPAPVQRSAPAGDQSGGNRGIRGREQPN